MIKRLPFYIIFIFILLSQAVFSQQQWVKTSGGSYDDKAYSITVDAAGYCYITGYRTTTDHGTDWYTIRYKPDGTQSWAAQYNGPGNADDKAYAIVLDKLNNIYVGGYSTGIGSMHDITVIKYNSSGTQQWVQRYNEAGNNDDEGLALAVDDSCNVYVTGFISRIVTDYYTIKYNTNGSYLWGQPYNGPGNDEDKAYAITLDANGNIYITGESMGNNNNFDYATVKYNRNGVQQWVKRYDGPGEGDDKAYAITVDASSGSIFITGYSEGVNSSYDFTTIKYNTTNGDQSWVARYNGPGNSEDKAYAITLDKPSYYDNIANIYVTGYSRSDTSAGSEDFLTIKYDNNTGDTVWTRRYDGTGNNRDIAYSLYIPKTNLALFVAGSTRSGADSTTEDIGILKYDLNSGDQLQQVTYDGPAHLDDAAYAIIVDSLDNIFLTGYVTGVNTGHDYVTMKYAHGSLIKVNIISSKVPKDFILYQNYPNPFNPSSNIEFKLSKASNVKLAIYDVQGRECAVLVNNALKAGSYKVSFTLPDLSSGVYFYTLTAGSFRDTKKMIMLK